MSLLERRAATLEVQKLASPLFLVATQVQQLFMPISIDSADRVLQTKNEIVTTLQAAGKSGIEPVT